MPQATRAEFPLAMVAAARLLAERKTLEEAVDRVYRKEQLSPGDAELMAASGGSPVALRALFEFMETKAASGHDATGQFCADS